jgi:hypothetical protein
VEVLINSTSSFPWFGMDSVGGPETGLNVCDHVAATGQQTSMAHRVPGPGVVMDRLNDLSVQDGGGKKNVGRAGFC